MADRYDLIVIGGGIVGLASAFKIAGRHPDLRVLALEKESRLAAHQTGHNSGVIHSGIYYKPGSAKARNCVEGRKALVEFAREHDIAHEICGKIIVATEELELPALEKIYQNGLANGVEGLRKLDTAGIREIEPHCAGLEGVWVPCTGIIDFVAVAEKLAILLKGRFKGEVLSDHDVVGATQDDRGVEVITSRGRFRSQYLVACAGLQCDRVARSAGADPGMEVVGFRGDYYDLSPRGASKVRNLIYPVPDPQFPFLGVHFTRMIHGGVECGPNAVFSFKREGYGKTDFSLRDTLAALSYGGTWKLFARHWRYGLAEYRRAFSKRLFLESLRKLIPNLEMEDLQPGRAGVRAVALASDGNLIDDFKIVRDGRMIHVLNAPSPAATACLSIGGEVEKMSAEAFNL